jgi:hypothetical protein
MTGSKSTPMNLTIPKPISRWERMKKGSKDGKTIPHQSSSPALEAVKETLGLMIIANARMIIDNPSMSVLSLAAFKIRPPLASFYTFQSG